MAQLLIDVTPFKSILRESKTKPGVYEVEGVMQRAIAKNQNGRTYSKAILERESAKYIEEFVKNGNAFGELDHPESPIVSLKNASHIVKELWWKGNDLMGRVELLNTPSGNIVRDFELVCWDFVSNPSTHGAYMNPITLQEGKQKVSKYSGLDSIINDILRA